MNTIVWWIMIALLAIIVMSLTDRVARRFLPLAALLKLSLVFPDEAPSRFKQALRQGTTNQLSKQMADHKESGWSISLTPQSEAAMSTSACWEPTGSGDAATNGCVGASTSIDSDGFGSRKTNVGGSAY
jgi:hypothetical protein